MMPGIIYMYDFGFIEMTRVTVENGAFEAYSVETEWSEDEGLFDDYATVFYFNYV